MPRPRLDIDPWLVREPSVDLATLGVTESLFSLANGYLGVRGSLEEGDPAVWPGTLMSGVYENHPLSYPEGGYGDPERGEAMIGVADGSVVRALVDGEPLDVREVAPTTHERVLDLRAGTLTRTVEWTTSSGRAMRLRTERLVSLVDRSCAALRYEITALEASARVVLHSELRVNATVATVENDDPRVANALRHPYRSLAYRPTENGGVLVHRTAASGLVVASGVEHEVDGAHDVSTEVRPDHVVTTIVADLEPGASLVLVKYLGHTWDVESESESESDSDALAGRAVAAVSGARSRGWEGMTTAQRRCLAEFWADADVEIDGDPALQQALRFNLFQVYCAAACISDAPIGAKGLTGPGYSGHTFWDIEGFVLPALTLLRPDAAARLLRWRASSLPEARHRAQVLDLQGATFAWRTISGHETSAYWPASTAAVHINADITRAFDHYVNVTGESLNSVNGFEVIVDTARLWISSAHSDARGYHFFGVTGPDEYTGVVDDNVFTNLMARRHLRIAADTCEAAPDQAQDMDVDAEEIASWRRVADQIYVPYDETLRVHPMNENFTAYREWRFEDKTTQYPVQENNHYAKFYRRQVCKQADLVQAIWWCRDEFTEEEVARDLDYYEARTVRDSSLSASVQAVVCAQAGHVDLALRYLREAAFVDLRDLQDNTDGGLHLASVAGAWLAFVAGLGGMREDHDTLELAPRLPAALTRTAYRLRWRGSLLTVETTRAGTTLRVRAGDDPVEVLVDGERVRVTSDAPVEAPLVTPTPLLPEPVQPAGRAPFE